jgi:hypothetical protein
MVLYVSVLAVGPDPSAGQGTFSCKAFANTNNLDVQIGTITTPSTDIQVFTQMVPSGTDLSKVSVMVEVTAAGPSSGGVITPECRVYDMRIDS